MRSPIIRNQSFRGCVECEHGGVLIEKYCSTFVSPRWLEPPTSLDENIICFSCATSKARIVANARQGNRRLLSPRLHVPATIDSRSRVYLRAREPQSAHDLLHHHVQHKVPTLRHASHDIRLGGANGSHEASDRAVGRALVRLLDKDMATIWRGEKLYTNAADCQDVVRSSSCVSTVESLRHCFPRQTCRRFSGAKRRSSRW